VESLRERQLQHVVRIDEWLLNQTNAVHVSNAEWIGSRSTRGS